MTKSFLAAIARLRRGLSFAQAAEAIANAIRKDQATTHGLHVLSLATLLVSDLTAPLALLLSAVALLRLIACGNVANLLLARSASRAREFAVRTAGLLISVVALVASALPTLRATHANPLDALRMEQ